MYQRSLDGFCNVKLFLNEQNMVKKRRLSAAAERW